MVPRARAALGDGQVVEAAPGRMRPDAERRAERGVVAVDEAEEMAGPRVDEAGARDHAAPEVAVQAGAERPGARQLQIAVGDLDVRQERRRARRVDQAVDGGHRAEFRGSAAAEQDLLERAVGRPVLGEDEHRDAGHVRSAVDARHGAAVAGDVPREPGPRLDVVEVVRDAAVGREAGVAEVRREEGVPRLDEDVRMPRPLPAEAEVQRHVSVRMPGVLHEQAQLVGPELLQPEAAGGDAGHGRRLQVEEDRPRDVRARRADAEGAPRSVRAGDVAVAVFDEADEAVDRVEDVAAVRHADELLLGAGPVVLEPRLEEMVAGGERHVVDELQPRVERRIDRQEEGQPDPEAVGEVHRDVGERPSAEGRELRRAGGARPGQQRAVVPAGPVLARPLDTQLVGERVGEQGAQAAVDRVRPVPLDPVGRRPPGVDVEGAVHLLRPRVVVLERGLVPAVEVQVHLGEQGARVVGAPDRSELVVEQPRPARPEKAVQPLQVGRVRDAARRLLGLVGRLLVVGEEEERPVAHERAAQRGARLVAAEVRLPAAPRRRKRRRDRAPLAVVVRRAGQVVGPRLRDHVDEPAGRAAELRGGALAHHHQILDGVLVEGEGGPLPAPLLAEEGVVEVGPVDDEVVEDAALPADVQLVAVRTLRDRRARGQQGQIQVVAAVARQRIDHVLLDALRAGHVGGVDRPRRLADDGHRLGRHDPQLDVQVEHPPDPQDGALDALGPEPGGRRRDRQVVGAGRQQGARERARRLGLDRRQQIGLAVLDHDHRPGRRRPGRAADGAADHAGGGSGLGREIGRVRKGQQRRQDQRGGAPGATPRGGESERALRRRRRRRRAAARAGTCKLHHQQHHGRPHRIYECYRQFDFTRRAGSHRLTRRHAMTSSGGPADAPGNRYPHWWTLSECLRLLYGIMPGSGPPPPRSSPGRVPDRARRPGRPPAAEGRPARRRPDPGIPGSAPGG